jgi:hypothetical protein
MTGLLRPCCSADSAEALKSRLAMQTVESEALANHQMSVHDESALNVAAAMPAREIYVEEADLDIVLTEKAEFHYHRLWNA